MCCTKEELFFLLHLLIFKYLYFCGSMDFYSKDLTHSIIIYFDQISSDFTSGSLMSWPLCPFDMSSSFPQPCNLTYH